MPLTSVDEGGTINKTPSGRHIHERTANVSICNYGAIADDFR